MSRMKKRYDAYPGNNGRAYVDSPKRRKKTQLERDLAAGKFVTRGAGK